MQKTEKFIHQIGKIVFVRISEMPAAERKPFLGWLLGKGCPWPDGEVSGNCAYVHDYRRWVNIGRPADLAEEIARENAVREKIVTPRPNMRKTVIGSEAFLIEVELQGEIFRVLWGVISFDETGRWQPGDYVCTTPIQETKYLEEGVTRFVTRSKSIYETTCPVQPYKAKSAVEFRFFMGGISPAELKFVRCLEEQNQLKRLATALFEGDEAKALEWLNTPLKFFEGKTPLEQALTEEGKKEVENLIECIEHGVFP